MKTTSKLSGVALAAAAAGFFAFGSPVFAQESESANVHCYGVNACKGQSACATASNSCKGQNACKGKGYVEKTQEECDAAGGTTTEPEASK
ncbi:MAG TPA: hypothetical protein VI566_01150 [Xanthomonadales bacterium]|nr:hypothetical protein [Xanthomonadales bacterium]